MKKEAEKRCVLRTIETLEASRDRRLVSRDLLTTLKRSHELELQELTKLRNQPELDKGNRVIVRQEIDDEILNQNGIIQSLGRVEKTLAGDL